MPPGRPSARPAAPSRRPSRTARLYGTRCRQVSSSSRSLTAWARTSRCRGGNDITPCRYASTSTSPATPPRAKYRIHSCSRVSSARRYPTSRARRCSCSSTRAVMTGHQRPRRTVDRSRQSAASRTSCAPAGRRPPASRGPASSATPSRAIRIPFAVAIRSRLRSASLSPSLSRRARLHRLDVGQQDRRLRGEHHQQMLGVPVEGARPLRVDLHGAQRPVTGHQRCAHRSPQSERLHRPRTTAATARRTRSSSIRTSAR